MLRLIKPSVEYRTQYLDFYEDWIRSGEDIVPWVVEKEPYDFGAYIDFLYAEDSEEKLSTPGWVPHSTYWLWNEEDVLVGAVNIRHRLNPKLLNSGGHIGYGIRPSYRRRGYAGFLLGESLKLLKKMGGDKALLVCDNDNIGSERTIVKHGGVFESEFREDDGNVVKRFWIDLGTSPAVGETK
ncbi:GNAT family N-acetyltransferase [Paenibacillus sp. GD4]|uniref:GNAT family N-acetyltransferase n=1 Tax=Paenibacillus sp. GD4 TaxID=3068890 RepID=UPI0027964F56|nr:GNAT family N-acetyltransferase [Paenibacillus sp. GD4]MDQ1911425.1 GNAT family N-acetyltransferase [Paenibacillus sp. GD4]